jgi:hypothetical protein
VIIKYETPEKPDLLSKTPDVANYQSPSEPVASLASVSSKEEAKDQKAKP